MPIYNGRRIDAITITRIELVRLGYSSNYQANEVYSNVIGTYGGKNLVGISYFAGSFYPMYGTTYIDGYFQDGSKTRIAYINQDYNDYLSITSILSIQYVRGGKTFRLIDLPDHDPYMPGSVWRNGNQLMISTG
jgi:hypothetical protein